MTQPGISRARLALERANPGEHNHRPPHGCPVCGGQPPEPRAPLELDLFDRPPNDDEPEP